MNLGQAMTGLRANLGAGSDTPEIQATAWKALQEKAVVSLVGPHGIPAGGTIVEVRQGGVVLSHPTHGERVIRWADIESLVIVPA